MLKKQHNKSSKPNRKTLYYSKSSFEVLLSSVIAITLIFGITNACFFRNNIKSIINFDLLIQDAIIFGTYITALTLLFLLLFNKKLRKNYVVIALIIFFGLSGFTSGNIFLFSDINNRFDDEALLYYTLPIKSKYIDKGSMLDSNIHYLCVDNFLDNSKENFCVDVSARSYCQVKLGDKLYIKQTSGFMGYGWISVYVMRAKSRQIASQVYKH